MILALLGLLVSGPGCVSEAVYFEARGEDKEGRIWVASVILNRVESDRFPDTECGVVRQSEQFSYLDVLDEPVIQDKEVYGKIQREVQAVKLSRKKFDISNGALYYHNESVYPDWAPKKDYIRVVGNHYFYK